MEKEQLQGLLTRQTEVIGNIALGKNLAQCLHEIANHIEQSMPYPEIKAIISLSEDNTAKAFSSSQAESEAYQHAADGSIPLPNYSVKPGTTSFDKNGAFDSHKNFDNNNFEKNKGFDSMKSFAQLPNDSHLNSFSNATNTPISDTRTFPAQQDTRIAYPADAVPDYEAAACWSLPIHDASHKVLGTFAIYHASTTPPTRDDLELMQHYCHLASLAIEKHRASSMETSLHSRLGQVNEKLNSLLALLPEALIVLDEAGNCIDVYGDETHMLSVNSDKITHRNVYDLWPRTTANRIMNAVSKSLNEFEHVEQFEHELFTENGHKVIENRAVEIKHYLADAPNKKHVLWMLRDITDQKHAQKKIEQLAFYDPLTELPNRRLLMNRTQKVIERVTRERLYGALIFIDLDGFKRINDSLGHNVGDELLSSVSQRLQTSIREVDTISRIGGDEFVILTEALQEDRQTVAAEAKQLSERILTDLEDHFELSGGRYKIGASIGIALIDHRDKNAVDVLKHADAAMYEAKKRRDEQICFHDTELQKHIDDQLKMESEINEALDQHAFEAYYQPQVDLEGRAIAAEALIRWQHPTKGLVLPGQFIAVAERMGVIHRMQEVVLNQACQMIKLLQETGSISDDFRVAINICPSQLKFKNLPETLMETLNRFDVSPTRLMLEITEGMLIEDIEKTIDILEQLRSLGFKISIDDFGKGYSSLSYLNKLPVHEIKIDKSFVKVLTRDTTSHSAQKEADCAEGIIDTMVSLSRHLNFEVIAEGIENTCQLEQIKTKSIKGLQGFFFARPMSQNDFISWICAA